MLTEEETTQIHGCVHGQTRRSLRIWALEEKARQLSLQRQTQKPPPSETNQNKRRGRKRKSLLLDIAVNSVASSTYDKLDEVGDHVDDGDMQNDDELSKQTYFRPHHHFCELVLVDSCLHIQPLLRVDSAKGGSSGNIGGRGLREEGCKRIKSGKSLVLIGYLNQFLSLLMLLRIRKGDRGGCRLGKTRERYAMTDMRKLANRMQFGVPEESSLRDGLGAGYGMLGQAGSGKLMVAVSKFKTKHCGRSSSTGATAWGLTSRLAFSIAQGIELHKSTNSCRSAWQRN
ncbi:unnamed protein product [Dovyalis caffra]|uniref:Prp31 C-terminal domain-containing protein n=1 Tax=Dovyalis caffra TaxID=77055 RepID=A0AAV1QTV1_9ROSI|nr:unnamed protein product [Dovyalis caffra]